VLFPNPAMMISCSALKQQLRSGLLVLGLLALVGASGGSAAAQQLSFGDGRPAQPPVGWKRGGAAPELAVWTARGGPDGGGLISLVDARVDAMGNWQSAPLPLPAVASDSPNENLQLGVELRLRHRIDEGQMRVTLRAYSEDGKALSSETFVYSGQSEGWADGRFALDRRTVAVPAAARSVRFWLISGGGGQATGELHLGALRIEPRWAAGEVAQWVPAPAQLHGVVRPDRVAIRHNARRIPNAGTVLMSDDFASEDFGTIPAGWRDLTFRPPSRNWMVDAQGFMRVALKNFSGLLGYEGQLATGQPATALENYVVRARFKTTGDPDVFFGVAGRVHDAAHYYAVRVIGPDRVRILKVKAGQENLLAELVLLRRYASSEVWELEASFHEDLITGIVRDAEGRVLARLDGRDGEFERGTFALNCTDFAAADIVACHAQGEVPVAMSVNEVRKQNPAPTGVYAGYDLVRPIKDTAALQNEFSALADDYDVIVAGGGTGGWAAAVQASRMGRRVLILEETDWLGGQMAAAAVTSMDEAGVQVRERGIYREFHESMTAYYYGLDKSPFQAYYHGDSAQRQTEGGYEPAITQAVLYGYIKQVREQGGVLDVAVRSRVVEVHKQGQQVTGVTVRRWNLDAQPERQLTCRLLVDATEYGDVIPLTGAPYRVGNTRSDQFNPDAPLQSHSYNLVFREYPDGIPEALRMTVPPPNYESERKRFDRGQINGDWHFHKGARNIRILMAWRGAADTHSPITGRLSEQRHTAASTNWSNNYRVTAADVESPEKRDALERVGIYRMLSALYYLQNEMGLNWSIAAEQGYDTPYNQLMMVRRGIDPSVMELARHLCQVPYVRESRRIIGVETLVANDLTRWEKAKHMPTSVAMGDYFMDLHGSYESVEPDLDTPEHPRGNGPFQVPFAVFIPQSLDGFLPAEKNFSQSRLVNGATRLQPITMLTGQAVGTIAALALKRNVQPRQLNPIEVQLALLAGGATLIQRWHSDVEWRTELWQAVQFLSLHGLLDRPGRITDFHEMTIRMPDAWGAQEPLNRGDAQAALKKLTELFGARAVAGAPAVDGKLTRGEFARWCLNVARQSFAVTGRH